MLLLKAFKYYMYIYCFLSIKTTCFSLENSGKMLGHCKTGVFWLRLGVVLVPVFVNLLVVWSYLKLI